MRNHRLNRLALLTQGAALVGIGVAAIACNEPPRVNSPPKEPTINSPPSPSETAPPASSTPAGALEPTHVNAAPKVAPTASSSASIANAPPTGPMHVNAPPKKLPPPPPAKP